MEVRTWGKVSMLVVLTVLSMTLGTSLQALDVIDRWHQERRSEDILDVLESDLESYVGKKESDKVNLVADLIDQETFPRLIERVITNDHWLEAIAQRSYYHVNGFDKLILLQEDNYSLRLHIWWQENGKKTREDIHNHRWDFISGVLVGTSVQELFSLSAEQEEGAFEMAHYRYTPQRNHQGFRYCMKNLGSVFLRQQGKKQISSGRVYRLKKSELHRVVCDYKETTATLVFYTAPYGEGSDVYSNHMTEKRYRMKKMSKNEVKEKLKKLLMVYNDRD